MKQFRKIHPFLISAVLIALVFVFCDRNAHEQTGGGASQGSIDTAVDRVLPTVSSAVLAHPAFAQTNNESISDIAEKAVNSVVNISSTRVVANPNSQYQFPFNDPFFNRFFGPDQQQQQPQNIREQALGSGVIIDRNGTIITNNHVVEGAQELKVTLFNNKEYDAEIIGTDQPTDIAVIRLKGDNLSDLVPMTFGNSDDLRLGDVVLAIGNPFGLGQTVSMGIISAKGRTGVGIETYEDFLQTDAAINPGNSGGALVNMRGELVGINTAIASETGGYQGIGFAIPSSMASQISKTLLAQGKVVRGWLGVGIQDLTPDMAKALGVSSTNGVIVSNVIENGPAAKAGLQAGDVITAVDGKPVTEVNQLQTAVAMINPDSQTRLAIIRDNKPMTLAVTLGTREEQAQAATQQPGQPGQQRRTPAPQQVQDLTVAPLDNQTRQQLNLPSGVNGVVISDLNSTGPASAAGLAQGDVILTVNRKTVTSIADFNASYGKATGTVLLYIFRNGNYFFVTVNK